MARRRLVNSLADNLFMLEISIVEEVSSDSFFYGLGFIGLGFTGNYFWTWPIILLYIKFIPPFDIMGSGNKTVVVMLGY